MTDFGKKVTPGDALREQAKSLHWFASDHERRASEHKLIAAALKERAYEMEGDADKYDKFQPEGGKEASPNE